MKCLETQLHYKKIKKISDGGFSNVYLVEKSLSHYALKLPKKNMCKNINFEKEYDILVSLNHPLICKCVEFYRKYSIPHLVMEFIDGVELYNLLYKYNKFDYKITQFISSCVLSSLIYLHDKNIIYRDIKPENIIINQQGYAILVDFGFSKIMNNSFTYTYCGTHGYMAPEIVKRKGYTKSVDMYSFGVLIHELYTGYIPLQYQNLSIQNESIYTCLQYLLTKSHNIRKSAHALRWMGFFNSIDFDLLEKYKIHSPLKSKIDFLTTT